MPKRQSIATVALVVRDYDEAIEFYVTTLGFTLVEDTTLSESKRWVLVAPPGNNSGGTQLLLAKADSDSQLAAVGNQTGGRVFLFLETDDCQRDFDEYQAKGVKFVRDPLQQPYGTVAVFQDLYGTQWDLIQRSVTITLELAEENDLPWVNNEYASIQFKPSNSMDHKVLIATCNGERAGLGRLIQLEDESGSWELGGIYVKPEFRGKGIARQIVQRLLDMGKEIDDITTIWCIPFGHLVPFYTTFGLEQVSKCSNVVPSQIKAKLGDCCSTFPEKELGLLKMDLLAVSSVTESPSAS